MEINQQVVQEFNKGIMGLRDNDTHLIHKTSVGEVLGLDLKRKALWVANVGAARKRRKQEDSTEMARMRTFFRNWQQGN